VALGRSDGQAGFDDAGLLLGDQLRAGSVYRLLAGQGHELFGGDYFADLFKVSRLGRPTVPARTVATVMLLQAHEGLSDGEAVDRLAFDLRWKAAAGLAVGSGSFHPTVLVGMRNRLRASDRPRRLFEDLTATARAAGMLTGRRRVFDSTPVYDAVATQDTVTQVRAAVRKLLMAADRDAPAVAGAVRAMLARDDETPPSASHRVTGTTRRRGRRWSTRWSATPTPRWPHSKGTPCSARLARPPSCWPWWLGRTWNRATTVCSGSPARWPGIG
jgi:hypothetical protein